jgi:hypothetical protein
MVYRNGCQLSLYWFARTVKRKGRLTVEQDLLPGMGTPLESARRNRKYLRSIGL